MFKVPTIKVHKFFFQIYGDSHEFGYHVNERGSTYGHAEASSPDITVSKYCYFKGHKRIHD